MPNALEAHETTREQSWQEKARDALPTPTVGRRVQAVRAALGAWRTARRQRRLERLCARPQMPTTALDDLARTYPDIYLSVLGR